MTKNELKEEISKWFDSADWNNQNFWNRDPVAKEIKKQLSKRKHFKGLRRGRNK